MGPRPASDLVSFKAEGIRRDMCLKLDDDATLDPYESLEELMPVADRELYACDVGSSTLGVAVRQRSAPFVF